MRQVRNAISDSCLRSADSRRVGIKIDLVRQTASSCRIIQSSSRTMTGHPEHAKSKQMIVNRVRSCVIFFGGGGGGCAPTSLGQSARQQRNRYFAWEVSQIQPITIQHRSNIDLGSIWHRSRIDPGSIQDRSWIDAGSILARSRIDAGSIQDRSRIDLGSIWHLSRIGLGSI